MPVYLSVGANEEMLAPRLLSWVKERHDASRFWIDGGNIRPFLQVAPNAAQAEVVGFICPAVLFADDVVDLVGHKGRTRWHTTIFA